MLKQTFQYRLFLTWIIYIGVIGFLLWLSWEVGVLSGIFTGDPTKLTYLISLFFIGGSIHSGIRSCYLSRQINAIINFDQNQKNWQEDDSLPANFLKTITETFQHQIAGDNNLPESDKQLMSEIYSSEAHAQHEIGWFITGLLVKLGLLGTVIGFVLMLQPLATLESFDIANIQLVLANMTTGMSVALNTTLLGLITSMLLSFQYLLLDRGADELVVRTVHFMETSLIPDMRFNAS